MIELPLDVIVSIFAFLDADALRNFALVNYQYSSEANRFLWRKFTLRVDDQFEVPHVLECCIALRRPIRATRIRQLLILIRLSNPVETISPFLAEVAETLTALSNLEYLECHTANPSHIPLILAPNYDFRVKSFHASAPFGPVLASFLGAQSDIVSFCIDRPDGNLPYILPSTTLPNLRHVSGDILIIAGMLRDRPISAVTLIDPVGLHTVADVSRSLSASKKPIREISLPLLDPDATLPALSKGLPMIKYLCQTRARVCPQGQSLAGFTELEVFRCIVHRIRIPNLPHTSEEVLAWTVHCPSLHTLVFYVAPDGLRQDEIIWRKSATGTDWALHDTATFHYEMGFDRYQNVEKSCILPLGVPLDGEFPRTTLTNALQASERR